MGNNDKLNNLIKEFETNGITMDSGQKRFKHVLDFQDEIGHRSIDDVIDYFMGIDKTTRKNFLWASCHCLDKDTFIDIITKGLCQSIINAETLSLMDIYDERVQSLRDRELNITELEKQNAVLIERTSRLEFELKHQTNRANEFHGKAINLDAIKNLLKG